MAFNLQHIIKEEIRLYINELQAIGHTPEKITSILKKLESNNPNIHQQMYSMIQTLRYNDPDLSENTFIEAANNFIEKTNAEDLIDNVSLLQLGKILFNYFA